jgi:transmembrane sensor
VLSDGTEVWLNTGSSLTYPSKFVGIDRTVKMTGEVFFDVAKNPTMPFKVIANGIETRALGTQFNINAYSDEPMSKITLIEGSIKVVSKKSNNQIDYLIVKPGQQVLGADRLQLIDNANLDEVMAWKNGQFYFEGANIRTIMGQISKYYNVNIEYKEDIRYSFVMKTSRTVPVSELLKIMELTDLVRFKIDGNKIIVMGNKKK